MSRRFQKGLIIVKALGILACVGALGWLSYLPFKAAAPAAKYTRYYASPTAADVDVTLRRAGLTPESLAAAGVSANETTAIVQAMWTTLTNDPGLLKDADQNLGDAQKEADRLLRVVRAGTATDQEVQQCQTQRSSANNYRTTRDGVLDTLFADLIEPLGTQVKTRLTAVRDSSRWDIPVEYRVVSHSDAEWIHLRDALANERIAANLGEDPDSSEQAFLSNIRSNTTVALAMTNLDTYLATITTAWNNAINQQ